MYGFLFGVTVARLDAPFVVGHRSSFQVYRTVDYSGYSISKWLGLL